METSNVTARGAVWKRSPFQFTSGRCCWEKTRLLLLGASKRQSIKRVDIGKAPGGPLDSLARNKWRLMQQKLSSARRRNYEPSSDPQTPFVILPRTDLPLPAGFASECESLDIFVARPRARYRVR